MTGANSANSSNYFDSTNSSNSSNYLDSTNSSNSSNLCPHDSRYKSKTDVLRPYFSESAFIQQRALIELEYYAMMSETIRGVKIDTQKLKSSVACDEFVKKVKEREKETNHDVKAIEYVLKDLILDTPGIGDENTELIHFGLTSQDVNSLANSTSIYRALGDVTLPDISRVLYGLRPLVESEQEMLAHTHGQTASPTTLGKEMAVYYHRIDQELSRLKFERGEITAKFGGAVGNMNVHYALFPKVDWMKCMDEFVGLYNVKRNHYTTQIDTYDSYARVFDSLSRMANIFINMCQDIWTYISKNYLKLAVIESEVGSSTMSHKVNPIDFENAEGNFMLACNNLQFLKNKLQKSRMQRDLTDSTVLRNLGTVFGWFKIGCESLVKGLDKIEPNVEVLRRELDAHYEVMSEFSQSYLRLENRPGYEILKLSTRGKFTISKKEYEEMLAEYLPDVPFKTTAEYIGNAKALANKVLNSPPNMDIIRKYSFQHPLKYGCNPDQTPSAIYSISDADLPYRIINGHPGYINLLDALNSWQLVSTVIKYLGDRYVAAASFKHVSPAGAAVCLKTGENATAEAYTMARDSDPMSSFGDFIAIHGLVDKACAERIKPEVSDGIIALEYTEDALEILKQKKKGRFIILEATKELPDYRDEFKEVYGVGFRQPPPYISGDFTLPSDMTESQRTDAVLANVTAKYTQSNSVVYAKDGQIIGVGAGQQSRIDCTRLAGKKAEMWWLRNSLNYSDILEFKPSTKRQTKVNETIRYILTEDDPLSGWEENFIKQPTPFEKNEQHRVLESMDGVTVASDGFLPFRDNIDEMAKYGVTTLIQPGGSVSDDIVKDACQSYNIRMICTGTRLFHH
uniref:Adenylosuccinate lyase n=1 Tax=viral metagenome TaxID=1070528 RepID=A0A6C0CK43_9ZZZZ